MKKMFAVFCLLLLALQAHGQTLIASIPVRTDFATQSQPNTSFLGVNWDKGEIYVSNSDSLNVISMATWQVARNIPLSMAPKGMCFSSTGLAVATTGGGNSTLLAVNLESGQSQFWNSGLSAGSNDCSFSQDGKRLYVASDLMGKNSVLEPKISEINADTGQVIHTWVTDDEKPIYELQVLPNGKIYLSVGVHYPSFDIGYLMVIGPDGQKKRVITGILVRMIAVPPDGSLAYMEGYTVVDGEYIKKSIIVDTQTDEIVYSGSIFPDLTNSFGSFPSQNDPMYLLVNARGATSVNLGQKTAKRIFYSYDPKDVTINIASHRQTDGSDIALLLREGRVDVYRLVQPPTIYSVASSSSFQPGQISPRGHYSLFGHALTDGQTSADWLGQKFEMAGTSVKVCGIQSRMIFVSPNQINFVTPSGIVPGQECDVEVKLPLGTATITKVQVAERDLSLFQFMPAVGGLPYPPPLGIMTTAQGELLGPPGISATPAVTQPKLGDVIVLWGNGGGVQHPDDQNTPMTGVQMSPFPQITIGGVSAEVPWAGLAPGFVALYQFNVRIPSSLPPQSAEIPYQLVFGEGGASYLLWIAK